MNFILNTNNSLPEIIIKNLKLHLETQSYESQKYDDAYAWGTTPSSIAPNSIIVNGHSSFSVQQ